MAFNVGQRREPMSYSFQAEGPHHKAIWPHVLWSGFLLFSLSLSALELTGNPNLFPTVVMLGTFLIPATYVVFLYDHQHLSSITPIGLALGFVYGGVLGVSTASVLEPLFIHRLAFSTAFIVGFAEEFAKMLGVLALGWRMKNKSEINGILLGAAAGMGFASLESSGYAFTAFLLSHGNIDAVVNIMLMRGLLSPLGHGTWTAILAGVLFHESKNGRFRITFGVVKAYILVSVLHGLWDSLPTLFSILPVTGLDFFIGEALVGGTGLVILWLRWKEAKKKQELEATS